MTSDIADHAGHTDARQRVLLWGYLLLVTVAELVTALLSAQLGQVILVLLLGWLALHGALGPRGAASRLALALTLAPLIRILSISLPLAAFPQLAWYPLVAIPLLIASGMIIRQLALAPRALGLRRGRLPIQLGLTSLGVLLGAAEYFILAPRPQFAHPTALALALAALNLLLFTGFIEELIFRGVLQALGGPALGRWALLYVSLLFGVLHIGYLSWLDVVFVAGVGLLFAYLVSWTGSILGVTLIHGLTNMMLFLVMPRLAASPGLYESPWVLAALSAATAMALVSLAAIMVPLALPSPAEEGLPAQAVMREARRGARMTYAALSAHTGLPMRALAEIEHGLRSPHPEELRRIAHGLGLAGAEALEQR